MTGQDGSDAFSSSGSLLDWMERVIKNRSVRCCIAWAKKPIPCSAHIDQPDRRRYDNVITKFDEFFKVRKNVIFERARFNRRNQLDGESAETFIMALYALAEHCEYKDTKEEMIRDRLVVGIRDGSFSERLQMEPDLTLEKAKKIIRQREAVHEQQAFIKGQDSKSLEEIRNGSHGRPSKGKGRRNVAPQTRPQNFRGKSTAPPTPRLCNRCGKGQHPKDQCPAKDAECHRCHQKGHYSSLCYSKTVSEVSTSDNFLDSAFLDTVSRGNSSCWKVTLRMCGIETEFKIDTGAEVTAVSEETYKQLHSDHRPPLDSAAKALYGPSHTSLEVVGQFQAQLRHRNNSTNQQICVIRALKSDLLGLPAIKALNVAVCMEAVTSTDKLGIRESHNLFQDKR